MITVYECAPYDMISHGAHSYTFGLLFLMLLISFSISS